MGIVIEIDRLSKHFQKLQALDDVSISVQEGEIYGFIGLNGAGKTTAIRMLLGMIRPSAGACFIKGSKVSRLRHEIWKDVGYMVETPHAYPELTVKENLQLFASLRTLPDTSSVDRVLSRLNLTRYAHKRARTLSLGNAQRLGIAKALIHEPSVLVLDEPVNGLDPAGIVEVRELLYDLSLNQGVTIFLSSHLLSEVSKITSTIGIVHHGRLIEELNERKLKQVLNRRFLADARDKEKALSLLSSAGYEARLNDEALIESTSLAAIEYPDKVAALLAEKGEPPTRLLVEEESLESYFLRTVLRQGDGGK